MKLSEININELIIEVDHSNCGVYSRMIYFCPKIDQYIKIWNKDFFYLKYFHKAGQKFFEGISLLQDIVTDDNGNIRGYITAKANLVALSVLDKSKFNNLIDRVCENSRNHNIIYIDFKPANIVEKDGTYYLIDLEPSIPMEKLYQIPLLSNILEFNSYAYIKKIKPLLSHVIKTNDSFKITRHQTSFNKEIKYGTADGRIYLEQEYLPTLSGKTLFAGVHYYTEFYHLLTKSPELFETLDVDEDRIEDGSPNVHYVCNILDFQNQGYLYDNVCCFGIFGHDSDWEITRTKEEIIKCINVLDAQVKPGGTFLFGPGDFAITVNWWDTEIYSLPLFKKYKILMKKKIGRNFIWYGEKI